MPDPSPKFLKIAPCTISNEGSLSTVQDDPGNWTGGKVGVGVCKGTKYGISAAQFPTTDIASLTYQQALGLYYANYWPAWMDGVADSVAFVVFDADVNSGPGVGSQILQQTVGVTQDGNVGTVTTTALTSYLSSHTQFQFCVAYQTFHLQRLAGFAIWAEDKNGYLNRNLNNLVICARLINNLSQMVS